MRTRPSKDIIVAIDGFSSCGKSTLAKALAKYLGYTYIDTGAMYRAVTLFFLQQKIKWQDVAEKAIADQLDKIVIEFKYNEEKKKSETYLNGENVEEEIRGKAVSDSVSEVSQIKTIRQRMVALQRRAGQNKGLVMDGRDIGTKVFPEAEVKVYMTADPEIRAQRRYDELKTKGQELSFEAVLQNLSKRDWHDTHREENPLIQAEDAIVLDNSSMNQKEQFEWVLEKIQKKLNQ
ncbi:MAG: cytidylate kinase [Verrucomicrobia bacterium]|nr:cytidylate kinase [Verrucomicrobiota bacterium]